MPSINLPPDIESRLDALAARSGRSRDAHAREAILAYIEDAEDTEVAEARLDALRRGESGTVPLATLLAHYGVEPCEPG